MKNYFLTSHIFLNAIHIIIFLCGGNVVNGSIRDLILDEVSREAGKSPLNRCGLYKFGCDGRCIDTSNACNGLPSCKDGADEKEELCGNCPDYYFQCDDEVCHPVEELCDGKIDCVDGSDENVALCRETCSPPHYFKCDIDQSCIPMYEVCDDYKDCPNGTDESKGMCKEPVQVSLTGGKDKSYGVVHIKFLGFWGTICPDQFTDKEAKVICRSLGYDGPASAHTRGFMGSGRGLIWLHNLRCLGNEANIVECRRQNWGFHHCTHLMDVGVSCSYKNQFKADAEVHQEECGISPHFMPEFEYQSSQPTKPFTEMKDFPTPSCVAPSNFVEERVRKGRIAIKNTEFPWIADLRLVFPGSSLHICGGAILSEYFVLTAAHCVVWTTPHEIMIRVGEYDQDITSNIEENFEVEKFLIHSEYNATSGENDIALVQIKKKAGHGILFNEATLPVCLPTADISLEADFNTTIAGWGRTENKKKARYLRMNTVPIISRERCSKLYGEYLSESMFCAGDTKLGKDACRGDSGGPLIIKMNRRAIVIGLVSWGEDCGLSDTKSAGVYQSVPPHVAWILNEMNDACTPPRKCTIE